MRVYSQKPRTALGWSGPLFQPDPFQPANVEEGIFYVRKMMLKVLEIGLPIADEALFLESGPYLNDLYSYVALGARSSEDHNHRVYASALDFSVGVKNPSSGDLVIAKNSVLAVNSTHSFLSICGDEFCQIDSGGNKFGHLILRGGSSGPNYQKEFIFQTYNDLKNLVGNPALIIDLNHNNSGKVAEKQPEIMKEIIESIKNNSEL
jgi:3-deoxy-7-phosphoheptulonate synthase